MHRPPKLHRIRQSFAGIFSPVSSAKEILPMLTFETRKLRAHNSESCAPFRKKSLWRVRTARLCDGMIRERRNMGRARNASAAPVLDESGKSGGPLSSVFRTNHSDEAGEPHSSVLQGATRKKAARTIFKPAASRPIQVNFRGSSGFFPALPNSDLEILAQNRGKTLQASEREIRPIHENLVVDHPSRAIRGKVK